MSRFRTSGRSVFDLIESEHRFVQSTYAQIQHLLDQQSQFPSSSSSSSSQNSNSSAIIQLCFILIRDVSVHSHKEEIVVYPLLQKIQLPSSSSSSSSSQPSQPSQACHEHVMVERQLLSLENELERSVKLIQPISTTAVNGLHALMKDLLHHIREEEEILLPALRSSMSEEESIRLGREWEGLNGRVSTRPHPDAPTLGSLAAAANAAQAPIDTLQDEARFQHMIPTAPGSITADALTPYEQEKLNLAQPTPGPNISMAPFHANAPAPSDLNAQIIQTRTTEAEKGTSQLMEKGDDAQQEQMSTAREKQMEMEMS